MISISTLTAQTARTIIIDALPESEIKSAVARVTQHSTLDGNAVISHRGFSHGDRRLTVEAVLSDDDIDTLWGIFTTESLVYISTDEGFFLGSISRCSVDNNQLSMDILIEEKKA